MASNLNAKNVDYPLLAACLLAYLIQVILGSRITQTIKERKVSNTVNNIQGKG